MNSSSQFTLSITGLRPYVLYSVVVSACTVGGCGDSPPTQKRTLSSKPSGQPAPTGRAQSATSILVVWDPPVNANGPIEYYVLYRRTLAEPISNNFTGPTQFVQIHVISGRREYLDTDLGIFSLQQYRVCLLFVFCVSCFVSFLFFCVCVCVCVCVSFVESENYAVVCILLNKSKGDV